MSNYLRRGIIGLAILGGMAQAAAQVSTDVLIDAPKLDVPNGTVAPASNLQLSPEQKTAIFNAIQKADVKARAPARVPATVGAQVPPVIELYVLPDSALATAPEAKGVKYTMVESKVVLVDPTTMRVVEVISQ